MQQAVDEIEGEFVVRVALQLTGGRDGHLGGDDQLAGQFGISPHRRAGNVMTSVGQSWPRCSRLSRWIVSLSTRAIEMDAAARFSAIRTRRDESQAIAAGSIFR